MISRVMGDAGIPYRRARFSPPPVGSYAVYFDDVSTQGPDGAPAMILLHSITLELYVADLDGPDEANVEEALCNAGLMYEKDGGEWLDSVQRYQINFYFDYREKRRAYS